MKIHNVQHAYAHTCEICVRLRVVRANVFMCELIDSKQVGVGA